MRRLTLTSLALGLALALAPGAEAQTGMMGGGCPMMGMGGGQGMGPGMGQGMGPGMGQGMGQGMGPGMMGDPAHLAAMVEGRLAYLHAALSIGEAQEAAWQAYAEAVRAQLAVMQQNHLAMHEAMQDGTAPARMNARIAAMSAMLAALQTLQPVTEALYGALDDGQKALADQLIGRDCGAF
jgi:hypothetical protein